jgi:hypothetical protein
LGYWDAVSYIFIHNPYKIKIQITSNLLILNVLFRNQIAASAIVDLSPADANVELHLDYRCQAHRNGIDRYIGLDLI